MKLVLARRSYAQQWMAEVLPNSGRYPATVRSEDQPVGYKEIRAPKALTTNIKYDVEKWLTSTR